MPNDGHPVHGEPQQIHYTSYARKEDHDNALLRTVNNTRGNDTASATVGATVGALHGRQGWPERWMRQLLGRTRAGDDGRVFELQAQARKRVWALSTTEGVR